MRFSGRIFIVVGGIFLATVLIAPLFKLLVDWLAVTQPAVAGLLRIEPGADQYDFGRVQRRLFMLVALVIILLNRRWLGPVGFKGVKAGARRARMLGAGLLLGVVSWGTFLVFLLLRGGRTLAGQVSPDWPTVILLALLTGLLVGLIEETAVRGYLLGGLLKDMPRIAAVLLSSVVYAGLHFLRARVPVRVGQWDPGVGLETLVAHVGRLADPAVLAPFIGLLLVGVVLSYGYLWSRSLLFAIGLHAGWVFAIRSERILLEIPLGERGLYGERGLLATVSCWVFLLLMLALLRPGLRRLARERRRAES